MLKAQAPHHLRLGKASDHQVELALGWAQRIVGLRDGQVVLDRAVDNLDQDAVMDVYRRVEPGQSQQSSAILAPTTTPRVA